MNNHLDPTPNTANPTKTAPTISVVDLAFALGDRRRWTILRELAKGEALPTMVLAKLAGLNPDAASKHMRALRSVGIVQSSYGRLYTLAPPIPPRPRHPGNRLRPLRDPPGVALSRALLNGHAQENPENGGSDPLLRFTAPWAR